MSRKPEPTTEARTRAVRPRSFQSGQPIGQHLRVERQVRVAAERTWYLVNNRQPLWYTRKCWECGNKHSPPTAQACTYCQAPLGFRRFLMAARAEQPGDAFLTLVERRLTYPTVAAPVALYRHGEQLLSIYPWNGENLLIGEPAPLPAPTLLSIGFQLADALSFLHAHGVILEELTSSNILISPDGTASLFDLEVDRITPGPLRPADDPLQPPARDLRELALALSHWCNVDDDDLRRFLKRVQRGGWPTADALAAAISQYSHSRRPQPLTARSAAFTDIGLIRGLNEDDWAWRKLSRSVEVYAVADGMGGHEAGEVASQLATRTLVRTLERRLLAGDDAPDPPTPTPAELEAALREAFQAANNAVFTMAGGRAEHMGTTLVALMLVRPDKAGIPPYALVANVGDSRAYRLRAGALELLTEDHSMVAAMVAAGKISESEAANHPRSNVLLNFLGMNAVLECDVFQVDVRPGDRFAVCTDGVWGGVPQSDLGRLLQGDPDPRRAVHRVLRAANDSGGRDNASVICLDT